MIYSTLIFDLT